MSSRGLALPARSTRDGRRRIHLRQPREAEVAYTYLRVLQDLFLIDGLR